MTFCIRFFKKSFYKGNEKLERGNLYTEKKGQEMIGSKDMVHRHC